MKIKQYCVLFLIFITLCGRISAQDLRSREFSIEGKISAFVPSSKISRQLFASVMPYYELEVIKTLCNNWQAWLEVGYLTDTGRAIGCDNKTTFHVVPVALGLQYLYCIRDLWDFYAGAGMCVSFFKNKDYSDFVHQNISKQVVGGVFKIGFIYQSSSCVFIDLFAAYIHQNFSFKRIYPDHYTLRNNFNMSGFKIGAGVGINF